MRYILEYESDDHLRVRIRDADTGTLTKGRFHTTEQAWAWVATQQSKALLRAINGPQTGMRGRASACRLTDSNYSMTNERNILWTTE